MSLLASRAKAGVPWTLIRQSWRYGVVGVISNAILYSCYLVLTSVNVGPKTAMTICFIAGVLQTFLMNRKWTFKHLGPRRAAFFKYVAVYVLAYALNLFSLWLLVDVYRLAHQYVVLGLVFLCAAFIFTLLKLWVFKGEGSAIARGRP